MSFTDVTEMPVTSAEATASSASTAVTTAGRSSFLMK
jgi:hypothetical protein